MINHQSLTSPRIGTICKRGSHHAGRGIDDVANVPNDSHRAENVRCNGRRRAVGANALLRGHVRHEVAKVGELGKGVVGKLGHLRDGRVVVVGEGEVGPLEDGVRVLRVLRIRVDGKLITSAVHVDEVVIVAKGKGLIGRRDVKGADLGAVRVHAYLI